MRLPLPFLLILLCTCVRAQGSGTDETEVRSTIEQATVYRDGAQVIRNAEALVPAGRSTLVFPGLTGELDGASIQLRADDPELLVLSVSHRLHFSQLAERDTAEQSIYSRIDRLERRRRELEARVAIAREEEELLRANRDLAGTANGLHADDLERGVNFHRERITAIKLSYLMLGDSLRDNDEKRKLLQEQLAELGLARQQPATREVVAVVESKRAQRIPFHLSYRVSSAGWDPVYDVRVTDISRPIDLRYHANVHQQTGEDWQDVHLVLSTGDPARSATPPDLKTWRIRPGQLPPVYLPVAATVANSGIRSVSGRVDDEEGMPLIGATVLVEGTEVGTVTDLDGRFELELPRDAEYLRIAYTGYDSKLVSLTDDDLYIVLDSGPEMLQEVVVVGYGRTGLLNDLAGRVAGVRIGGGKRREDDERPETAAVPVRTERRATTVNFAIELPYTIPSDGKPRTVEIKRYAVPATYHHLAVPKRDEDVYLSAVVRDWEQYDLISGDLQLFFEGTYLGTSRLEVEKTADTLLLSLGRDAGVVVTRRPGGEFRVPGGLFTGKQVDSRGWTIAVRNTKSQPINLTILDQVPVSADGRVDVELALPAQTELDEPTGLLTWKLTLLPASERKLDFGYSVKYPSGERVYME